MAKPKQIFIKESIADLKKLMRNSKPLISKRLQILIETKKYADKGGVSKRTLSDITGVNHNSILRFWKLYEEGGIDAILKHGRIGFKQSNFTTAQHKKIETVLNNPTNGIVGYKELQKWVKKELETDVLYITLLKYVQRHFGAKVKVARKSHIKKDEAAVHTFKKTSVKSVLN